MNDNISNTGLYSLYGKVPLTKAVPFGLQHVLSMFVGNLTPVILLAAAVGMTREMSTALIQNAMLIAGIGTLIQLYPLCRIGSGLPIVMGISITFVPVTILIGTTQGMGILAGAVIVGGLVEGVLGLFARYWSKIISPIVAATVVTAIGFSLMPVGVTAFGGGKGAADFGCANNWIVGSFTFVTCLLLRISGKKWMQSLSILLGLLAGYILSCCLGMVNLSGMKEIPLFSLPKIVPFKPEFRFGAILSVVTIYLVSLTETLGDTYALASSALKREATGRELSGSIACDGFISSISGLFGCPPISSFSQNIGLITLSGVINKFAIATGATILVIASLFPGFGFILTSIPQSVLGGCSILLFSQIILAGFEMISRCGFNARNLTIVSLSLTIGIGFTSVQGLFNQFPAFIQETFEGNCVAIVFLLALILNLVIKPERTK